MNIILHNSRAPSDHEDKQTLDATLKPETQYLTPNLIIDHSRGEVTAHLISSNQQLLPSTASTTIAPLEYDLTRSHITIEDHLNLFDGFAALYNYMGRIPNVKRLNWQIQQMVAINVYPDKVHLHKWASCNSKNDKRVSDLIDVSNETLPLCHQNLRHITKVLKVLVQHLKSTQVRKALVTKCVTLEGLATCVLYSDYIVYNL